ncbi:MAG: phosphatidate cytidylyltransferase [Burkholderiales bacterium]|jgi:phosphatidate cytidylyltransferase
MISWWASLPMEYRVISVLCLFLLIMSAIGWGFKNASRFSQQRGAVDNLIDRVNAWWLMVLFLGMAIAIGKYGLIALFFFVSFQCLREFLSLTVTRRGDHRALLWSFWFFLPLQYILVAFEWYGLFSILIPVYAFLLLPVSAALGSDTKHFLQRTSTVQWALMLSVYCLSHLPALIMLDIPGYTQSNVMLIIFLLLVVQFSDVFQYIWGKLLGKRKLAPEVSPSKTVEGLVGGVISATLLGAALSFLTPFNVWQAALVSLTINTCGFFGGFVLSAVKRDRGVKDWGNLIPGHGGMLDRVDSLTFAAPIYFHILRYWWVP